MKTLQTFFCFLLLLHAEVLLSAGSPKLLGLTSEGGSSNYGVILLYNGGDTTTGHYDMTYFGYLYASLMRGSDGLLYGMSPDGGTAVSGTLFSYDYYSHALNVLVNFYYRSGDRPEGTLIQASNGIFYGLTSASGPSSGGTLFSYTIGDDSILMLKDLPYAYARGPMIQAENGKLYGLTCNNGSNNGGTIFEYDIPNNNWTTLYSLPTNAIPCGSLIEVGLDTFYGITCSDGSAQGGTIFRYSLSSGNYQVLHNFQSAGDNPSGSLIRAIDGKLYGTVSDDAVAGGHGSLFCYDINTHSYTTIYSFTGGLDGLHPRGSLFQASDSMLYGMTFQGGRDSMGTIFQYNPYTSTFTSKVSLSRSVGDYPLYGNFIEYQDLPLIVVNPVNKAVCAGDAAIFIAASDSSSDSVQWQVSSDGGHNYTNITGANTDTLSILTTTGQNGLWYRCVYSRSGLSSHTLPATLTVYAPSAGTISASICAGSIYHLGGATYDSTGVYTDTLHGMNARGCDSIVTLHLIVYTTPSASVDTTICMGSYYPVGGHLYNTPGIYTDTLNGASVRGCDSVVVLRLGFYPSPIGSVDTVICGGSHYSIGGQSYDLPGVYVDTLHAASRSGCDSIVILHLAVVPATVAPVIIVKTGFPYDTLSVGNYSAYQWFYNGHIIAGDIDSSCIAQGFGDYTVVVSDKNVCGNDTATIKIANDRRLRVSPNPAGDIIKIQTINLTGAAKITITDALGKEVFSEDSYDIIIDERLNISSYGVGVYILRMQYANGRSETFKFVKD